MEIDMNHQSGCLMIQEFCLSVLAYQKLNIIYAVDFSRILAWVTIADIVKILPT
mgnify:CR=1 FL=1